MFISYKLVDCCDDKRTNLISVITFIRHSGESKILEDGRVFFEARSDYRQKTTFEGPFKIV
jgi:hypothetical protein